MTKVLQPGVNIAIISAITEVPQQEQKVLFVGQKTAAGIAVNGELITDIQNDSSWDVDYGENSMLADMIRNARALNTSSQFDAIGLSDNGTTFATIDIVMDGTATEDGELVISIGSFNNHTVTVSVSTSDTASTIGDAIESAIDGDARMPFSANNVSGTVTLTAINAGTYGNTMGVQITGVVAGITLIVADGTTGATDPVLTSVFDVIGDTRYQTIVWPYAADTTALRALLDPRFNTTDNILDGVGITTAIGTATALSSTYSTLNSQSLTVIGDNVDAGGASNLVDNGDFSNGSTSWVLGVNWSISSERAQHTTTGTDTLSQTIVGGLDQGESYVIIYNLDITAGGGITVSVGGTAGTLRNVDNTYSETIVAGASETIVFTPAADFAGFIDNVALYKVTPTGNKFRVPSIFEIPAVLSSEISSVRALRRTDGANIASFLAGEVGLDAFGSAALSSRPYFNTPFSLLPVAPTGVGFTSEEVEDLFDDGVSVMGNNSAGNTVILGEMVTTYKTDSGGNPDDSFKFLNYVDTASAVREYFFNNLRARFAQSRLTEGDLVPGRPMANAALILSTLIEFYTTLSGSEFALTQAGETARTTFISNTTVSIDLSTGVVTVLMQAVPLVTQLRQINATMTIAFSANG